MRVIDQLNTTSQTTQTNEDGYFVFTELRPGKYTLSVEKNGFGKLAQNNIVLLTADRLSVGTLILRIGSGAELVTVTSESPAIETTSSEQSAVISADEMASLPVIGNDYVSLTKIVPGSTYLGNGNNSLGLNSSQASFMGIDHPSAAYFSTNGVFSSFSNYSWDDSPTVLANIQDVKVQVSGYEPEYGKAIGAVLNVTTKSGAKDFHGSLWYAFRNEDLNANDYFNNSDGTAKKPISLQHHHRNAWGAAFHSASTLSDNETNSSFSFPTTTNRATVPQGLNETPDAYYTGASRRFFAELFSRNHPANSRVRPHHPPAVSG